LLEVEACANQNCSGPPFSFAGVEGYVGGTMHFSLLDDHSFDAYRSLEIPAGVLYVIIIPVLYDEISL